MQGSIKLLKKYASVKYGFKNRSSYIHDSYSEKNYTEVLKHLMKLTATKFISLINSKDRLEFREAHEFNFLKPLTQSFLSRALTPQIKVKRDEEQITNWRQSQ